jgi:hypothetical protein
MNRYLGVGLGIGSLARAQHHRLAPEVERHRLALKTERWHHAEGRSNCQAAPEHRAEGSLWRHAEVPPCHDGRRVGRCTSPRGSGQCTLSTDVGGRESAPGRGPSGRRVRVVAQGHLGKLVWILIMAAAPLQLATAFRTGMQITDKVYRMLTDKHGGSSLDPSLPSPPSPACHRIASAASPRRPFSHKLALLASPSAVAIVRHLSRRAAPAPLCRAQAAACRQTCSDGASRVPSLSLVLCGARARAVPRPESTPKC